MPIYQRKSRHNAWYIDLHANGRRLRRKAHVQSLEGALEEEQRMLFEIAHAEQTGDFSPLHGCSTFVEFAKRWMTDYVAVANRPSTQREKECALRIHLIPAFGHMRLDRISTNVIDAAVAQWLRQGMSIKRVNNVLTILRKAFCCSAEWGFIAKASLIRHHRYFPPIPQYLTRAESERLIDCMRPGFWRMFIRFLLGTGVRFGEATALRWDDLDLESNRPTVAIRPDSTPQRALRR